MAVLINGCHWGERTSLYAYTWFTVYVIFSPHLQGWNNAMGQLVGFHLAEWNLGFEWSEG